MTALSLDVFDRFRQRVLENLKEIKENKTWNAADLAEKSGLSVQSIYSLAGGQRGKEPEFSTIFKLAQAMGWTMDDIVADLFPERAGTVYRLFREHPSILDHLFVILDGGSKEDLDKLETDMAYMAKKLTP